MYHVKTYTEFHTQPICCDKKFAMAIIPREQPLGTVFGTTEAEN